MDSVDKELYPYRIGKCVGKCEAAGELLREAGVLLSVYFEESPAIQEDSQSIERMHKTLSEIQRALEDVKLRPAFQDE